MNGLSHQGERELLDLKNQLDFFGSEEASWIRGETSWKKYGKSSWIFQICYLWSHFQIEPPTPHPLISNLEIIGWCCLKNKQRKQHMYNLWGCSEVATVSVASYICSKRNYELDGKTWCDTYEATKHSTGSAQQRFWWRLVQSSQNLTAPTHPSQIYLVIICDNSGKMFPVYVVFFKAIYLEDLRRISNWIQSSVT